ncbi:hypothetical protein CHELA1G11_14429 [Hyphomicrobiales bacterium]|nr:hypothetical protein CHELA1G11_14429 [Hyphomicrobiales bacterium]
MLDPACPTEQLQQVSRHSAGATSRLIAERRRQVAIVPGDPPICRHSGIACNILPLHALSNEMV